MAARWPQALVARASTVATEEVCCRIPAALQDGDLVFRRGRDLVSHMVLSEEGQGHFSHVGVIVLIGGRPNVVHAMPAEGMSSGGVVVEPLERFAATSQAESVTFDKPHGIDAAARQRVRRYLLAQVGKPFDASFRFSDERGFYCTALALKALRAGGMDLTAEIPKLRFTLLKEAVYAPDALHAAAALRPISPQTISFRPT